MVKSLQIKKLFDMINHCYVAVGFIIKLFKFLLIYYRKRDINSKVIVKNQFLK